MMNWNNLRKDLCPRCEDGVLYKKVFANETYMMRCNMCMFVIMQEKYEYLLATIKEDYHVHEVDENLTYLNNL